MTWLDALHLLGVIVLQLALVRVIDWMVARPKLRELHRFPGVEKALDAYRARRDARAEADPDAMTQYARRHAVGVNLKDSLP